MKYILIISFLLALFTGCTKDLEEYNKPAIYWYNKMVDSIAQNDLDKADDYYTSLQGEHISSPLLPTATQILALAHIDNEEYILANYFFDEYIKRYATNDEKEFFEFKKIETNYRSLPNLRRDQKLIKETISDSKIFLAKYPYSQYRYEIDTILTRLLMAQSAFNRTIAKLYKRVDKYKSAKYYEDKDQKKWIEWSKVVPASQPWYREWFEGDGDDSWYSFLIPDTQSVVSRNSNKDTNSTK